MKPLTKFCSINSYHSIKELLNQELHFSAALLKKHLPKKFLEKSVRAQDEIELPLDLVNNNFINPRYEGNEIQVIFEDQDFIVLNKPAGIHGHALEYSEDITVLNFLRSYKNLKFLAGKSDNSERGLLYRLDFETSGVLIFVKDESLHRELRENFSSLMKEKTYLALIEGKLEIDREVRNYLQGSSSKGAVVKEDLSGQLCIAHMKTVKVIGDKTLVEVNLQTGFRHQIRVQLALLGHPIVGDSLYGAQSASRMFLHALKYSLECRGEKRTFYALEDKLFCDFLNTDSLLEVSR
ncbi:RluA family pseudouridine synthase [Bacteriovorax sp. Seq25_V]|uniref:RluA family pseudouridine synthase n=1 Tax=Bacteriovorax sp. Seq25_V TaxID=1201288 RepID=UPI00038A14A4|nr:RNA pseudouridine synthase [Bacteriovorax sp. Seq25_V]EQC45445.1 RNA pseudouridine synthase [Bacteriovorax sp. Seq25_V]